MVRNCRKTRSVVRSTISRPGPGAGPRVAPPPSAAARGPPGRAPRPDPEAVTPVRGYPRLDHGDAAGEAALAEFSGWYLPQASTWPYLVSATLCLLPAPTAVAVAPGACLEVGHVPLGEAAVAELAEGVVTQASTSPLSVRATTWSRPPTALTTLTPAGTLREDQGVATPSARSSLARRGIRATPGSRLGRQRQAVAESRRQALSAGRRPVRPAPGCSRGETSVAKRSNWCAPGEARSVRPGPGCGTRRRVIRRSPLTPCGTSP